MIPRTIESHCKQVLLCQWTDSPVFSALDAEIFATVVVAHDVLVRRICSGKSSFGAPQSWRAPNRHLMVGFGSTIPFLLKLFMNHYVIPTRSCLRAKSREYSPVWKRSQQQFRLSRAFLIRASIMRPFGIKLGDRGSYLSGCQFLPPLSSVQDSFGEQSLSISQFAFRVAAIARRGFRLLWA